MNLDDLNSISVIDSSGFIQLIRKMPDYIRSAWQAGCGFNSKIEGKISRIILCSTGMPHITDRILAAYLNNSSSIQVSINTGELLPEWVFDGQSLVIVFSQTGTEPELNRLLIQCSRKNCHLLTIFPEGKEAKGVESAGFSHYSLTYSCPSKIIFIYTFFFTLGLLASMGLVMANEGEIVDLVSELEKTCNQLDLSNPIMSNPAKRLAGQFMNRLVTLFASEAMVDVANLWKAQINENAKAWAQVEDISTASRSTAGAMCFPEASLTQMMTIFLESPFDTPVCLAASGKLRELFMVEGFNTDYYVPSGNTPLKAIWNAIIFGIFVSYYLAIAYGIDPFPNPAIEEMVNFLSEM